MGSDTSENQFATALCCWRERLVSLQCDGAVSQRAFKRIPVQARNLNAVVFSSGDWQLQTPRWRVPLPAACESCSDVANRFGSRARLARGARWLSQVPELLLQWKNPFCSLIPLCSPYISGMVSCQGLELGRNYNAKVFWGWASRDCRFCVGANGPEGFSFARRKSPGS